MAAATTSTEAVKLVEEVIGKNEEITDETVSQDFDSDLLKSFLSEKPIHSYYGITPNDFCQYLDKNKADMVTKYYKDMLNKKLNKAAALTSVTRHTNLVH